MLINIYNYQFKSSVSSVFVWLVQIVVRQKGMKKEVREPTLFCFLFCTKLLLWKCSSKPRLVYICFSMYVYVCMYVLRCFSLRFVRFFNVVWLESFKYDFICAASCGCFAYLTRMQLICSAAKNTKVAAKEILNNIIQFFYEFSFSWFKVSCDKIRSPRQYYSLRS